MRVPNCQVTVATVAKSSLLLLHKNEPRRHRREDFRSRMLSRCLLQSKFRTRRLDSGWQGACRAIRCFGAIGCNNMVKVERILERFSMFFHGTFGVLGAGTGGFLSMSRSVRGH